MFCNYIWTEFYSSERALYDDEIIEDVCENMCTVMFKLGIQLLYFTIYRRTS